MKTFEYKFCTFAIISLLLISACSEEKKDIETPLPSTVADFEYEVTRIDGNSISVKFTNKSIQASSYLWEFGINDLSSSEENPTFVYDDTIGEFTVKLTCTPTNDLYYNKLVDSAIINTTPVIWAVGFNDGKMPEGTALFNLDGGIPSSPSYQTMADSAWVVRYRSPEGLYPGGYAALGLSYYAPPAEADDWMIFKAFDLPDLDSIYLSWWATSLTTSGNYPDHYEVGISTTDQTPEACLVNILASVPDEQNLWIRRKVSLSQFKGQTIYIGFHLNTPYDSGDRLAIDEIEITAF